MVLPDRIELSTSPLPMECSTTELRQHARDRERIGPKGPSTGGPVLATRPPLAQARGNPEKAPKWGGSAGASAACGFRWASSGRIRFRVSDACAVSALARRIVPRIRSFLRLCHVFRQHRSLGVAIGRGDKRCQPSRVFYGLSRQCIFSLIGDFSQTTELRQVHDDRSKGQTRGARLSGRESFKAGPAQARAA